MIISANGIGNPILLEARFGTFNPFSIIVLRLSRPTNTVSSTKVALGIS